MIVKSQLLSVMSGKMAGVVGAHNSGGQYLRGLRVPVNPNTAQQQVVRDDLSLLQGFFANTLTGSQRTGWATFASNVSVKNRVGDSIYLSGQNWYIKANVPRLQASVARVDVPPTTFALIGLTLPVPTITAAGTTVSVAFTAADAWATASGGALLVYASRPQNATRNFFAGPFRFAGKVAGAVSPPSSPAVLTLPWPSGPSGSKQWFRFVATGSDGRPSATFLVGGTV